VVVTHLPAQIRPARSSDIEAVTQLCTALWPDEQPFEHATHVASVVSGAAPSTLPLEFIVAEIEGQVVGFIEVGLRSHADGCDTRQPVGFVEGWYVRPSYQRRGIGRALVGAAEEWARTHGAREIASDTWIDNIGSQRAHEALGFEVVDRCVTFRKALKVL
jgi:aminoglycoside 6'-N-acetyltransferase I